MAHESYDSFEAVKSRLDEIVDAVNNDELPLDDALVLYEEAVRLGLRASDLLEENIEAQHASDDSEGADNDSNDEVKDKDEGDAVDAATSA